MIFAVSNCGDFGRKEADFHKTPIFFIHAHGMKAEYWNPMIDYFRKKSYPENFLKSIQLLPATGSNIVAAESQIQPAIESFLSEINNNLKKRNLEIPEKSKVDLISHGMGALSARWYTAQLRPERVRIWISLGGANHGTNVLCTYFGKGAEECCPAFAKSIKQSMLQYILNGLPYLNDVDETPYGMGIDSEGVQSIKPDDEKHILYYSIRTSTSNWIKPESSAILDGAGGIPVTLNVGLEIEETQPGNFLIKTPINHDRMSDYLKIQRLIESLIDQTESYDLSE